MLSGTQLNGGVRTGAQGVLVDRFEQGDGHRLTRDAHELPGLDAHRMEYSTITLASLSICVNRARFRRLQLVEGSDMLGAVRGVVDVGFVSVSNRAITAVSRSTTMRRHISSVSSIHRRRP